MENPMSLQQAGFNVFAELERLKNTPKKFIDCSVHGKTLALLNGRCQACRDDANEKEDLTARKIRAGLKGRYLYYTFDDYVCESDKQRRIKTDLENYNGHANLILVGNCGTGKSMLASCIIDKSIREGHKCGYIDFHNLTDLCIRKGAELDRMAHSDLLIIDEVGVGNSEFKGTVLHDLINERYKKQLYTVLISNLNAPELVEFLSEPVYSRLKEKCVTHNFDMDDYRLKGK